MEPAPAAQVYPAAQARRDSLRGKLGVSLPLLRSAAAKTSELNGEMNEYWMPFYFMFMQVDR